jgi:predicted transglutaminase-like cysteine proteinase
MSSGSPTTQSAKHHRVDFWKIVAWAGLLLAGAVHMVDPLDLFSSSVVPISLVAADSDAPEPAAIEISVTSDSATTKNEGFVQLFGMDTEPVDDGALLDKWRRVRADITKDLEIIAQCRAGKSCPASAQRLISLSLEGYGRSDRARVGLLHSNSGDCEDYAIFKYAALLADGVSHCS